jgi:hypothetical protein
MAVAIARTAASNEHLTQNDSPAQRKPLRCLIWLQDPWESTDLVVRTVFKTAVAVANRLVRSISISTAPRKGSSPNGTKSLTYRGSHFKRARVQFLASAPNVTAEIHAIERSVVAPSGTGLALL